MRLFLSAVAIAGLSACVVLDTAPPEAIGPGPFLTGGQTNVPTAVPQVTAAAPVA